MGEVSDPEQQYSLRWNDFHASIISSFRHLRDEEDFVDVTLACDGCSFTAHKVVLSACSPYFRRLLKANPCQHPIVILRDVKEKDMECLLRFMYNGEVHIGQEQLADFLKTAQMLQVRGLADVPTKESQKLPPTSNSLPWSQSNELRENFNDDALSPPPKRSRNNEHRFSPSPSSSATHHNNNNNNNNNNNGDQQLTRETLLGQALEGGSAIHPNNGSHQNKGNSDSSLQAQSTGEDSNSSDTAMSDRGGPMSDLVPKSEPNDYSTMDDSPHHGNGNLGLDAQRTPTFPAALLGLQGIPGLLPGPSGLHSSSQEASFVSRRGLDMMRVRATDPRPCPKCGKIYRSAHTLRTHLEDKHTVCPGYRCVLCGTVAKSRNSLHSHMSRQHRGISTKDLPVLPMPSPFDPELASRLLAKAGVKVSAAELRARASPTGPRRPDLRLEVKTNHVDSIRYSGAPSEAGSSLYGGDDPEDLTVPNSRLGGVELTPLSPPTSMMNNSTAVITKVGQKHLGSNMGGSKTLDDIAHSLVVGSGSNRLGESNRGPPPPPPPPQSSGASTGSAILDTYLQFIAENSNNLAMGMSGEQAAAHAAAAAAHAAKAAALSLDGKLSHRDCEQEPIDGSGDQDLEDVESSGAEDDDYSEDEQEIIKAE